jgi:DNA replication protein
MDEQSWMAGYQTAMQESLSLKKTEWPFFFISTYRACGLDERQALFVLQLLAFAQAGNSFPLQDELAVRTGMKSEEIVAILEKLLSLQYLKIDNIFDQNSGIHSEHYNIQPLLEKSIQILAKRKWAEKNQTTKKQPPAVVKEKSLFLLFEEEFGRLLSPMECEMINKWIDEDNYPQPLIRYALREAVFAGKLHFRYIDRILLEWHHQRVQTVEQAKQFSAKFRGLKS